MRDSLRAEPRMYEHLDAAQQVKHASGRTTQNRKVEKIPMLSYLYAGSETLVGRTISNSVQDRHRQEMVYFAESIAGVTA